MNEAGCQAGRDDSVIALAGETIAVVIPAHNEEGNIGACLDSLRPFAGAGDEIVVVDACSTDRTAAVARGHGAAVRPSPCPERACAARVGYEHVAPRATIVLIAHADMRFQERARAALVRWIVEQPDAPGAFFGHRIDDPRGRFRIIERGNRFRAHRWRLPYGDQAMAVRTAAVGAGGGFPTVDALEDLELALRLRRIGRWANLHCPVTIDARHWRRGVVRTTVGNWRTVLAHRRRRRHADSQESQAAGPMTTPSDAARSKQASKS